MTLMGKVDLQGYVFNGRKNITTIETGIVPRLPLFRRDRQALHLANARSD